MCTNTQVLCMRSMLSSAEWRSPSWDWDFPTPTPVSPILIHTYLRLQHLYLRLLNLQLLLLFSTNVRLLLLLYHRDKRGLWETTASFPTMSSGKYYWWCHFCVIYKSHVFNFFPSFQLLQFLHNTWIQSWKWNFLLLFFWDKDSLCSPGWPWTLKPRV
jgi:hypothetical protein